MVFALEPESTESLQATLAFIDETLGDSTPANSPDSNAQLHSPSSEDWETSHLLDDFMTDESSPRVAADLALVAEQPMHFQSLRVIGNALFAPEAPKMSSLGLSVAISTTIETPAQSPSRKKRRNYNPNKARQELQRELTYLRREAHELEAKLQQLQTLKVAKTKDGSTPSQLAATRQTRTGYGSFVWEDTCHRQLECRLRSERENAYLKSLLDGQVQAARSLEKLLSKRAALHATETSGSKRTTRVHVSRTGSEIVDAKVFEELADGVEASYREAESVFVSSGLELSNVSSRKVQMRDSNNGMFLEIFDSKVLPFDMLATGEAWWRRWNHFNPNRGSCYRLESTEDTIVEHFGMEMSDVKTKTSAKFYVQQILRRYIEEDRVVVVWQSHIEPLKFSHRKLAGIRFREKGYVIIKPHQISPGNSDGTCTLVQTCHIIKPDLSDQRLKKDARTGALADFVLSATVANIAASAEMIEGLLMDEALQQRSRM